MGVYRGRRIKDLGLILGDKKKARKKKERKEKEKEKKREMSMHRELWKRGSYNSIVCICSFEFDWEPNP